MCFISSSSPVIFLHTLVGVAAATISLQAGNVNRGARRRARIGGRQKPRRGILAPSEASLVFADQSEVAGLRLLRRWDVSATAEQFHMPHLGKAGCRMGKAKRAH